MNAMTTHRSLFTTQLLGCLVLCAACTPAAAPLPQSTTPAQPNATAATDPVSHVAGEVGVAGTLLPPMPVAVTSFGGASDGSYLYAVGGYAGIPHNYSREGQSRAVMRLALEGSRPWEAIGEMEHGLQGLGAIVYRHALCRFGGNRADNAKDEPEELHSVAEAACFDLEARAWRALPDLPAGRSSLDVALIGSTVYVGGGWKLDGAATSGTWQNTLLALDLAQPGARWQEIASPVERRALALAAAGGRVVAIGGMTRDKQISRRVDVFDPSSGRWSQGPDFPADAFGLAATGNGDAVYASARDGVLYRWTLGAPAWNAVRPLAFPRFFHRLVPAGAQSVIAFGGISGMHEEGRTRHVERIDLQPAGASIASLTLDYPGAAKNRQAIFLEGDFLYLFGGNNSLEQHDFAPENFVAEGWRLHLPSMEWQRVADYPIARQSMQTVQWDDQALAIGGFGYGRTPGGDAVSQPEAYQFDFEHERFTPRAGLPADKSRTQFGLVEHDGTLWIFGGLNYDPQRKGDASFDHVTSVLTAPAAEKDTPFVELDVAMPGPRRAFAGAVLGDRYYMVGGMRGEFELVEDCAVFDFKTRSFAPLPCPRAARLSAQLVALAGRLYLVGGSVKTADGLAVDRSIEVFDPAENRWQVAVPELPFDTRQARALTYGNQILIVSTQQPDASIRIALVGPAPAAR